MFVYVYPVSEDVFECPFPFSLSPPPLSLADRSFCDIMQYPVMPWIIADYTSDKLGQLLRVIEVESTLCAMLYRS
jgi:hypothetical protein